MVKVKNQACQIKFADDVQPFLGHKHKFNRQKDMKKVNYLKKRIQLADNWICKELLTFDPLQILFAVLCMGS